MRRFTHGRSIACALLLIALSAGPGPALIGCSENGEAAAPASAELTRTAADSRAHESDHDHARESRGRPLSAFDGWLLEGGKKSISEFLGKRLLLFFFNPEVDDAGPVADAVARIAAERGRHNFGVVGIAVGTTTETAKAFVAEHGLEFPVFDDSTARISPKVGVRQPVLVLGVDAEGYLEFAAAQFVPEVPDPVGVIEEELRDRLRLPDPVEAPGRLDARPAAPDFSAPRIDGGDPFNLADHSGEPVVLVFFLHTCPHCHAALRFFKAELEKLPADRRPVIVGISVQDRPSAVRAMLREEDYEDLTALVDPSGEALNAYGIFGGVPDILFVARDGRIERRIRGWNEDRDPALARMTLAKIAGAPIPMILSTKGYTGSDVCGICHGLEHATWQFTSHASAFDTLVKHAADRNGECVSCHVVGFGEPGGFDLDTRPAHLEDVGCEVCHGRGGPHLSPAYAGKQDYSDVCGRCHNPEHSLGFDYGSFLPKVSHSGIASLSDTERAALIEGRDKPRDILASSAGTYVGSDACQGCHAAEYATWAAGGHARAVQTLEAKGAAGRAECLACHTTAFGREGGFAEATAAAAQPDLARVGCESCHGPGSEHVREGSRKLGSIVSLGDKCDSCVILQICGSCHDEANDPGFRFEVEARIEAQRHGTIEAGTGRPLAPQASLPRERGERRVEALLEDAFRALEQRG